MQIVQPDDAASRRRCLRALIQRPGMTAVEVDEGVDALVRYAGRYGLDLQNCLGAEVDGRIVAACLCVDAPGRTTSVFLPSDLGTPHVIACTDALLQETVSRALGRNIQFMQATIEPEAAGEADILARAGFEFVTTLIYLENDLTTPRPRDKQIAALEWVAYGDDTHHLFTQVIEATYEDSLDCGSLNGRRSIEDILASHRAVGEFDPQLWSIGVLAGRPAGVVLVNCIPQRWVCEVVYMGVVPSARRQGVGRALLSRAVELARERAAVSLNLTVDVRNVPAQQLYASFGFREESRRDVWIRFLE
jgi:mycothiol synthase